MGSGQFRRWRKYNTRFLFRAGNKKYNLINLIGKLEVCSDCQDLGILFAPIRVHSCFLT